VLSYDLDMILEDYLQIKKKIYIYILEFIYNSHGNIFYVAI